MGTYRVTLFVPGRQKTVKTFRAESARRAVALAKDGMDVEVLHVFALEQVSRTEVEWVKVPPRFWQ